MKTPDQQEEINAIANQNNQPMPEQTIPVSGDSNPTESTPPDARVNAAFEKAVPMETPQAHPDMRVHVPVSGAVQMPSDNLFELMPPDQLKDGFAWSSSKESTLFGLALRDMDEPSLRIAAGWLMQHYSTAMARLQEISAIKGELESIVQKQEMDSVSLREQLINAQRPDTNQVISDGMGGQQVVRQDMGG